MAVNDSGLVGLSEIRAARQYLKGRIHQTPVAGSTFLGGLIGADLYFKLEMFQKTGSFKPRGVLNKMRSLSDVERRKGVISLSAGNHGQALAYAASMDGVESTIVMPAAAVRSKVDATRGYGGTVLQTEGDLLETALTVQRERDLTMVHPFDDLHTIAGTGTLGLEILDDVPGVDLVVVSIGGGGLISGVAAAIKLTNPRVRVVGVEPDGAPGMTRALREGRSVQLDGLDTVADGLAAPFVGQHNLDHVRAYVDDVVLVSDDEIIRAMVLILERAKVLAEPAAAASYAALLSGKIEREPGETVACILSGGNIDSERLVALLSR